MLTVNSPLLNRRQLRLLSARGSALFCVLPNALLWIPFRIPVLLSFGLWTCFPQAILLGSLGSRASLACLLTLWEAQLDNCRPPPHGPRRSRRLLWTCIRNGRVHETRSLRRYKQWTVARTRRDALRDLLLYEMARRAADLEGGAGETSDGEPSADDMDIESSSEDDLDSFMENDAEWADEEVGHGPADGDNLEHVASRPAEPGAPQQKRNHKFAGKQFKAVASGDGGRNAAFVGTASGRKRSKKRTRSEDLEGPDPFGLKSLEKAKRAKRNLGRSGSKSANHGGSRKNAGRLKNDVKEAAVAAAAQKASTKNNAAEAERRGELSRHFRARLD